MAEATRPRVLASKIITMLDPRHAFLLNRNKTGSMALAGESLFVLEMQPAWFPGKPPPVDALITGSVDEPSGRKE